MLRAYLMRARHSAVLRSSIIAACTFAILAVAYMASHPRDAAWFFDADELDSSLDDGVIPLSEINAKH